MHRVLVFKEEFSKSIYLNLFFYSDDIFISAVENKNTTEQPHLTDTLLKIERPLADTSLKVMTMNNYFGIGIDAEMALAFHLAREENPERCTSR